MTAIALPAPPRLGQRAAWVVADTLTLAQRNLLVWMRVPAYIAFTVIQPVLFTLMFRYVFGGAIGTHNIGGYVDYLIPGIVGQTAAFASMGTAIALADELQKGVIDRLRSMPMARSAVLLGRLLADGVRMLVTIVIIVAVGYGVGFRYHGGAGGAIGMLALAEVFGLTVCTISAYVGLQIKNPETVQAIGMVWLFPFTFVSSAFVPVASMPGWLQAFALHQPVSIVINAIRALSLGTPAATYSWESVAWLAGILAVFIPLAVRAYRRVQ